MQLVTGRAGSRVGSGGEPLEGAERRSASPSTQRLQLSPQLPASYLLAALSVCVELRSLSGKTDVVHQEAGSTLLRAGVISGFTEERRVAPGAERQVSLGSQRSPECVITLRFGKSGRAPRGKRFPEEPLTQASSVRLRATAFVPPGPGEAASVQSSGLLLAQVYPSVLAGLTLRACRRGHLAPRPRQAMTLRPRVLGSPCEL
uniref:Uncharacterized protein n=1 Tax=Rangifer tarandus platyrhynchus TaxID=3082113 RepID=A0ACB0F0F5_RANTA|nr:unnamed protein product [Rangifer tarandus platyrhynchus]